VILRFISALVSPRGAKIVNDSTGNAGGGATPPGGYGGYGY